MSSAPQPPESARGGLGCPVTGKTMYPSAEAAQARLDEGLVSVDGSGNIPARVYQCPLCEGWHLTHHKRRRSY